MSSTATAGGSPSAPKTPAASSSSPTPAPASGFLIATVEQNIPIYQLKKFGFIHDVWVDPQHRRSGIARALVEEAANRFRAMGITQLRLETAAANEHARDLFTACGFRVGTIDMLRQL